MAASSGNGGRWLPDGRDGPSDERDGADERPRRDQSSRQDGSGRSDIAEFLSGGMLAGLTVLILGLLGLIYVFSASEPSGVTDASIMVEPSEAVTATRINGSEGETVADDVAGGTTGEDIDGDGDVGVDERSPVDGRAAEDSAARDVDGDGDTAADRESPVDPAAGGGTVAPQPDGSAAPTDAGTPSDATGPTEGVTQEATDAATAGDQDAAVQVLPGPGERASEQRTAASEPATDGAASERPSAQARRSAATMAPADAATEMPDRARGTGLFSPDDPGRQVATVPDLRPRDERVVHVDLDGDGEKERVWAAVVADQVLTRIERVVDGVWTPVSEHTGAVADRLVALRARDLTGDGRPEVITRQWVGTEGESLTLWSYADNSLRRMTVTGGCADGSNTIGLVGALVRVPGDDRPGLVAVCRDPDLSPQQWPSGLYEWRDGTWTFLRYHGELP